MNTILNNWFIHPEYKDEIGVYVQCKDYHHYLSIFDFLINPPTYYAKNKIFGYCNDEMDRFLTHNETYNSDGNTSGYFDSEETNIKEHSNGLFDDRDEFIIYYDEFDNCYYDGSGLGFGYGHLDGSSI